MDTAKISRRDMSSGFTLIELLVTIAIIGVLLAILIPGAAIQKAREAAQDAAALDDLTLIGKAEITFHAANGTYTDSLSALPGLPATIASAKADGHTFSIPSSSSTAFKAESRRTVLAKTGNEFCTIDQTLTITCPPVRQGGPR